MLLHTIEITIVYIIQGINETNLFGNKFWNILIISLMVKGSQIVSQS